MRWNRRSTGHKEEDIDEEEMSKEELDRYKEMDEKLEAEARLVYDIEKKKLDMGNR